MDLSSSTTDLRYISGDTISFHDTNPQLAPVFDLFGETTSPAQAASVSTSLPVASTDPFALSPATAFDPPSMDMFQDTTIAPGISSADIESLLATWPGVPASIGSDTFGLPFLVCVVLLFESSDADSIGLGLHSNGQLTSAYEAWIPCRRIGYTTR
jgi:hypothetical protein